MRWNRKHHAVEWRPIILVALVMLATPVLAQTSTTIRHATLMEPGQKTQEVSTEELQRILRDGAAVVFDVRPPQEFAVSHIPGAMNVSPKPGVPMWRALGGVTQVEPDGIRRIVASDRTAVLIDAREVAEFKAGSVANARSLPRSGLTPGKDVGEVKAAKDDGRLPMEDHNTRILVFGATTDQARAVAEAVANEAFHNVSFFDGNADQFKTAARP